MNSEVLQLEKPEILKPILEGIPDEMKIFPQWLVSKLDWNEEEQKWIKPPYCPLTGQRRLSPTTYEQATAAYLNGGGYDAPSFALTGDSPYIVIDIDNVVDPTTSEIDDAVLRILQGLFNKTRTPQTYCERSLRKKGLHFIVKGKLEGKHVINYRGLKIELFGQQFNGHILLTGHSRPGNTEIQDAQDLIDELVATSSKNQFVYEYVDHPKQHEDGEIIRMVMSDPCDSEDFGAMMYDYLPGERDNSDDDWAFVRILSRYTQNEKQIDDIYRKSNLARSKWDEKRRKWNDTSIYSTYGCNTIQKCLAMYPLIDFTKFYEWVNNQVKDILGDRKEIRLIHISELLDSVCPPDWLIQDWLERDTFNFIFGEPTAFKSFLTIDWACRIATGTPWFNYQVEQAPIIYIAGEGVNGVKRRFLAWAMYHRINLRSAPIYVYEVPVQFYDENEAKQIGKIIQDVANKIGQEPGFIGIDTLARNFGGDENSAKDISIFQNNICKYLKYPSKAAIQVVHHTGHSEKGRARGSSAILGNVDAEFRCLRNDMTLTLEALKTKDGDLPVAVNLQAKVVPLGMWDKYNREVTSLVLTDSNQPVQQTKPELTQAQKLVLLIHRGVVKTGGAAVELGVKTPRVTELYKECVKQGWCVEKSSSKDDLRLTPYGNEMVTKWQ